MLMFVKRFLLKNATGNQQFKPLFSFLNKIMVRTRVDTPTFWPRDEGQEEYDVINDEISDDIIEKFTAITGGNNSDKFKMMGSISKAWKYDLEEYNKKKEIIKEFFQGLPYVAIDISTLDTGIPDEVLDLFTIPYYTTEQIKKDEALYKEKLHQYKWQADKYIFIKHFDKPQVNKEILKPMITIEPPELPGDQPKLSEN